MFSTGVAKPDISTEGTATANVPRMACCCEDDTEEIIRPMPTIDRMNRTRQPNSSGNEPRNGMPNRKIPAQIMTVPSTVPMISAGTVLEMMISRVVVGDTSNWSKVPSSRSRAIDSAVTSRAMNVDRMPDRPGTMNQR